MEGILKIENLSIGYGDKNNKNTIASGLCLALEKGKLIALIGQNGIGKSTLLRTVTGIQKPIEGAVFIRDKNIRDYSAPELAQELSVVLTEKLPPSNLTVFELVALGRQPYTNWIGKLTAADHAKINEAIALTQIDHLKHKRHYEISDGQLQKVLIARALAQDTPLIILDEPTTHLDLVHKVTLFRLLKKLSAEAGKCIVFSTHDIELAIQLSDEIIVMTPGAVQHGKPANLIKDGVLSRLFQDESIDFDAEKAKFIFKGL